MGRVNFFALWSLRDAPQQFISKSNRLSYRAQLPLPLPKQLVVFSLGDWKSYSSDTTISVEVLVSPDVKPQKIGGLSSETRCLVWEGDWRLDLLTAAMEQADLGVSGKIVLTVSGKAKASFTSSTPMSSRKRLSLDWQASSQQVETFATKLYRGGTRLSPEPTVWRKSRSQSTSSAELSKTRCETRDCSPLKKPPALSMDHAPKNTVFGKRVLRNSSSGELSSSQNSTEDPSLRKKRCVRSALRSDEEKTVLCLRKSGKAICPSPRWSHTMCLSDPETAVLIGGESKEQTHCKDSLWKLEIDNDFWFPMDSSASGPTPPSSLGHSATYDPESKKIYVFGGMKDGKRYSDIYILCTLTWKWSRIAAKGKVPTLAYHSATIYKKELFVFGGVYPSRSPEGKACSNALYIFNPEYELWYQPIVEGDKPLPRFGHTATLLMNKLIIFGGKKTPAYLSDLHIMDLGFMEYTAVKYENTPPVPRGFHAAVPVSDYKILISGGCSTNGALQDIHLFNLESCTWSSVPSPALSAVPRAGHSMVNLAWPHLTDADKQRQGNRTCCTILVFGGSDCAGNFYNDTLKTVVELETESKKPCP
nr:PREDICTED: uncharacterized protein LOC102689185 [Lepisosteus oculatus]